MLKPLQIDFQDLPPSAGLTAAIRRRVGKLEQLCHPVVACRVTVEATDQCPRPGSGYTAHVRLSVPGTEIDARRERRGHDSSLAILDAFDAIQLQLEDYVRGRHELKRHSTTGALLM
jgi:ribosome-associated translation inhibitor RaiA